MYVSVMKINMNLCRIKEQLINLPAFIHVKADLSERGEH